MSEPRPPTSRHRTPGTWSKDNLPKTDKAWTAGRLARSAEIKRESAERVAAFHARTAPALLAAMQAAFTRKGCTWTQSKLISDYVLQAWGLP